jgi:2-oxoacid dehydrogenases acyltransferase (catalytic domain)
MKLAAYLLDRRTDAQVFGKETIFTDKIDSFLAEKRGDGRQIGYTAVMIAALVRTIAERPRLNRFVVNGQLYARHGIHISMTVKRSRDEDAEETSIKLSFTGTENIFDVAESPQRAVGEARSDDGNVAASTAERIMAWPGPTKKSVVGLLKVMDRYNVLPRPLIEVSPFHSSVFFSQLKSIRTDYVYHHLWNVGTAGIFVALGEVKDVVVPQERAVVVKRACEFGFTVDERMCDGVYLSRSLELLKDYLQNPCLLEQGASRVIQDVP